MIKQIILIIQQLIPLIQQLLKRKQNEEMVRRICKEENLNEAETMDILGTIAAESSFDDKAIGKNTNGSRDFGICQWNDYWSWTREKIISPEDALNNPELAVKKMVEIYKKFGKGKNGLGRWYGYKSKNFYAYLKKGSL